METKIDISFLKQLEFHRIPEWSNKYIEYEKLFYIIQDLEGSAFARSPKRSLDQVVQADRLAVIQPDFEMQTQEDGFDTPTDLSIFTGDRTFDITPNRTFNEGFNPDTQSMGDLLHVQSASPELMLKDWKTQLRSGMDLVDKFLKKKEKQYTQELNNIIRRIESVSTSLTGSPGSRNPFLASAAAFADRAANSKRAFVTAHTHIWWLELYREINELIVRKLVNQMEKIAKIQIPDIRDDVNVAYFTREDTTNRLRNMRQDIYQHIAKYFTNGSIPRARSFLLSIERHHNPRDIFIIGFSWGVTLICILASIFLIASSTNSDTADIYHGAIWIFRLTFCFVWAVWMATGVMAAFEWQSLNYIYIFKINPENRKTSYQMLRQASQLTALWFVLFTCFNAEMKYDITGWDLSPFAIINLMVFIIIFIQPWYWNRTGRYEIINVFFHLITAPFAPVEFRDFYLGDLVTSLRSPFTDIFHAFCFISLGFDDKDATECWGQLAFIPILSGIPYFWRFLQCLNRIYMTQNKKQHTLNAWKYFSGIAYVAVGATSAPAWLKILTHVISVIYLGTWDIFMDWGLRFRKHKHFMYRHKMHYPKKFYYIAAVLNMVIRVDWIFVSTFTLYGDDHIGLDVIVALAAWAEIYRRAQWTLFRVENERMTNEEQYRDVDIVPRLPFKHDMTA